MKDATVVNKLHRIQQELKAPKSLRNDFSGFNYRSAEKILEEVKPLLGTYNCVLTLSDEVIYIGNRYYIKAIATLEDLDSKTSTETFALAREQETKKGMDEAQITGAASSYARKYALNGLFAIDDTKDPDTFDNRHEKQIKSTIDSETRTELATSLMANGHRTVDQMNKYITEVIGKPLPETESDAKKVLTALKGGK